MEQATLTNQQKEMKENISAAIKESLKENNVSVRSLAKSVDMKHPQILRITKGENYTIDTLSKVLSGLGLELIIQPKQS